MSSDLVKFVLPAAFVVERVRLRPCEVALGYSSGWLDEEGVVKVAESLLAEGASAQVPLRQLALLVPDEWGQIPGLIGDILVERGTECRRVWLYLVLDWVYSHTDLFDSRWQTVEMIFADFDYPEDLAGFVRFMPAPENAPVGLEAMEGRWRDCLTAMAAEFGARRA